MKLQLGLGVSYGFRYQTAAAYYFQHLRVLTTNTSTMKLCSICIFRVKSLDWIRGRFGKCLLNVCYNMNEEWYWFSPSLVSFLYVPPFVLSPPISVPLEYFLGATELGNSRKKKRKLCFSDSCSYSILIDVKPQMFKHSQSVKL